MYRCLAILLFLCGSLFANKKPLVKQEASKLVVAKLGAKSELIARFTVTKGFHVQSNPPSESFLIPTKLSLEAPKGLVFKTPVYPKCGKPGEKKKKKGACKPHRVGGLEKAINTYAGTFDVKVPYEVSRTAKKGKLKLSGKLRYQACNAHLCFPPRRIPVTLDLQIGS